MLYENFMDVDTLDKEERQLLEEKYAGDAGAAGFADDRARLAAGEPLAYVIGWQPFLGLKIWLDSKPLIPRPETEWWTEELISYLKHRFTTDEFRLLDLCAGSGAIGIAILKAFPNARASFGEISEDHAELIRKNLRENGIDAARADVRASDLFGAFADERYDIIAANPPYVPEGRTLDASVAEHEPHEALYAGADGLAIIERIAAAAPDYLTPGGEAWIECDSSNAAAARTLLEPRAKRAELRTDQYGRPRLVIGYY